MGLLDRLFGKRDEVTAEERLPSHQTRYDHHAPIDLNAWGQDEEPLLDMDFAAGELLPDEQLVTPDAVPTSAAEQRQNSREQACQMAQGEGLTLVLTVMANEGDHFEGGDLLREFNASALHLGKDGLFHRYPEQGERVPLFSVSNALNPGVFELKQMMALQTRGLVLFVQLPTAHTGKVCFGALVETANRLALGLGGQVLDGERRPLSNHMLQHMQEQVLEFDYCRELERRKAAQQDRKW